MLRSYGQFFICIVWIIVAGGFSPVTSSTFLYDGPKLNCIDCLQLDSTTTTTVPSTTTHPTTVPTTTETTTVPTTTETITVPATTETVTVPSTTETITVPATTETITVPTTTVIDSTSAISTVPSEVIVPKITTAKGNATTRLPDVTGSTLRSGRGSTVTDKNKKKPEKDKHKNLKENPKKTKKAKYRRCYKKKITEEVNETSAEKFHRYMDYIFSDNVMVCLYAISLGIPLIVAFVLVVLKGKVYYEKEKKRKTRIQQSSRPGIAPKSEVLTPV